MKPYFSSAINDTVHNIDEHRMLEAMMNRTFDQVEKYATELDIRGMADNNLRSSRMYQFAQKCIEARRQILAEERLARAFYNNDAELDLSFSDSGHYEGRNEHNPSRPFFSFEGFMNPLSFFVTTVVAWNAGWYLGDRFADMLGAADQKEIDRLLEK